MAKLHVVTGVVGPQRNLQIPMHNTVVYVFDPVVSVMPTPVASSAGFAPASNPPLSKQIWGVDWRSKWLLTHQLPCNFAYVDGYSSFFFSVSCIHQDSGVRSCTCLLFFIFHLSSVSFRDYIPVVVTQPIINSTSLYTAPDIRTQ